MTANGFPLSDDVIQVQGLTRRFGTKTALDSVSLTVLALPDGYAGEVLSDEPLAYYRLSQPGRA